MDVRFFCRAFLLSVFLPFVCLGWTSAQSPELPSAPAPASSNKPLTLPKTTPILAHTTDAAPPLPPVEEDDCYAPAEGIYALQLKDSPPEVREAAKHYFFVNYNHLDQLWLQHMPRAASDPWVKGGVVAVRFAIMPDGTIDTPIITLTSGHKKYDQHALDTVLKAAPFPPLPAIITHPLPMCMRFGYNMSPEPHKDAPKASPY